MFDPSDSELKAAGDLFSDLLQQGRKLLRSPEGQRDRLAKQQEEARERGAVAAAKILERMQWRPRASIVLISKYRCVNCHNEHQEFQGFGVSMYRNSDNAERLVMTPALDRAWPLEVHFTNHLTAACTVCLSDFGFEVPDA
jgi:hypothetical protein